MLRNCSESLVDASGAIVSVPTLKCVFPLISTAITWLLAFVGIIIVVLIIYAGIRFIFSGGDSKKIEDARKIVTFAILGMVVIFTSFGLVTLISQTTGVACIDPKKPLSFTSCGGTFGGGQGYTCEQDPTQYCKNSCSSGSIEVNQNSSKDINTCSGGQKCCKTDGNTCNAAGGRCVEGGCAAGYYDLAKSCGAISNAACCTVACSTEHKDGYCPPGTTCDYLASSSGYSCVQGCSNSNPDGPCPNGGICAYMPSSSGYACSLPCNNSHPDGACPSGQECKSVSGTYKCVNTACSNSNPDGDCPTGLSCAYAPSSSGYICLNNCSNTYKSGYCPSGSLCAYVPSSSGYACALACNNSHPTGACPSGQKCDMVNGVYKCNTACSTANPNGYCNTSGQDCLYDPSISGYRCQTAPCSNSNPTGSCQTGYTCAPSPQFSTYVCLENCSNNARNGYCRPGTHCDYLPSSSGYACIPN